MSNNGLLTTVAYKLGKSKPASYALEVSYCHIFHLLYIVAFSLYIHLVLWIHFWINNNCIA